MFKIIVSCPMRQRIELVFKTTTEARKFLVDNGTGPMTNKRAKLAMSQALEFGYFIGDEGVYIEKIN